MLYLGIDQHRRQLTVCVRNDQGDIVLRRQVSTEWARVREFLEEIRNRAAKRPGPAPSARAAWVNSRCLSVSTSARISRAMFSQ